MDGQEALFWKAIEEDPADATVRLAFADWLGDQNDPREAGMRALAAQGLWTHRQEGEQDWVWFKKSTLLKSQPDPQWSIPNDWFRAIEGGRARNSDGSPAPESRDIWCDFDTLAEADSALCLAFLKLRPGRRAQLLSGVREAVVK